MVAPNDIELLTEFYNERIKGKPDVVPLDIWLERILKFTSPMPVNSVLKILNENLKELPPILAEPLPLHLRGKVARIFLYDETPFIDKI